jgi:hypothetical protein
MLYVAIGRGEDAAGVCWIGIRFHRVQLLGPDCGQVDALSVRPVRFEFRTLKVRACEEGCKVAGGDVSWRDL